MFKNSSNCVHFENFLLQVEDTKIRIGRALLAQVDDAHQKAMIRKEEQKKLMGQLNYFQFFLVNPPFSGISRKKLVHYSKIRHRLLDMDLSSASLSSLYCTGKDITGKDFRFWLSKDELSPFPILQSKVWKLKKLKLSGRGRGLKRQGGRERSFLKHQSCPSASSTRT